MNAAPSPKHRERSWRKLALKGAGLAIVCCFWLVYIRQHWHSLQGLEWQIGILPAALAVAIALLGYFVRGLLWDLFRHEMTGHRLGFLNAFRISAIAWMGRYVPGKVWSLAGKACLSARDKQDIALNTAAAAIDIAWFQASGLLLGLSVLLCFPEKTHFLAEMRLAGALVIALAVVACHPGVFAPVLNVGLRLMHQAPLPRRPRYRFMLFLLACNMAVFVLWTAGFFFILRALSDASWADFPPLLGVFCLAWVAGFLVLLAPAGLGVRDSVMALGMQEIIGLDPSLVIVAVVAARLLSTLTEFLCFLIALALSALGMAPPAHQEPPKDP